MATKAKKSSSVKSATKSTKKTAAKKATSSKLASEKVSKTSKKAEAKVSTKSNKAVKRELTPMEKIRSLHISSVVIYIIFGILVFFLVGKITADVFVSYQAENLFLTDSGSLVGANENVYALDYRYYIIAALAIAAIGSLLLATSLRKAYEKSVIAGLPGYRWLIFGLSFAVLTSFVTFAAGVQDFATLKVVGATVLLASLIGWLADRENSNAKTPKKVAFYISVFGYLAALIPLASSLLGTSIFGSETFEWYVYALSGVILLAFIANMYTQKASITNKAKLEYFAYETRYIRINQLTNFLVVLILVAALQK